MMEFKKRGDGAQDTDPLKGAPVQSKKKTQESVIVYIAILFTVAFLLVLLSYFMQQRRSENTINSLTETHTQFTTQALQNIEDLQNRNISLTKDNESLKDQTEELKDRLEEAERLTAEVKAAAEKYQKESATREEKLTRENEAQTALIEALTAMREVESAQQGSEPDLDAVREKASKAEELKEYLPADKQSLPKEILDSIEHLKEEKEEQQ